MHCTSKLGMAARTYVAEEVWFCILAANLRERVNCPLDDSYYANNLTS